MPKLDNQQYKVAKLVSYAPPLHSLPPTLARFSFNALDRLLGIKKVKLRKIDNIKISTHDNQGSISLRVYWPNKTPLRKQAMIYFHGGGCVIGDLNSHDRLCRYLCEHSQTVIISVAYRLAPKYKFPTAIIDALHAWNWINSNKAQLDLLDYSFGAGGDSAGAYLATIIALPNEHIELPVCTSVMPSYLYLLYPMMDLRGQSESYKQSNDGMLLTNTLMDYFSQHYLENDGQKNTPLASPILIKDISKLPKTFILTCGFDPLKDSGIEFANKLKEQGISTDHKHLSDCMHSFISVYKASQRSRECTALLSDKLKQLVST